MRQVHLLVGELALHLGGGCFSNLLLLGEGRQAKAGSYCQKQASCVFVEAIKE
ncbi:hypothetical protein GCM10011323_11930 [Pontibacter amylolyticus]|uniref:Uncharacterized protein n=1 Tax=Pontibacter amylolyticus TaxID=1424080 RepID=A0ABQ1W0T2_9BACT|nr:hypothetical protein GCM10011323_11930 [Pontibacter amylolyticus]